MPSGSQPLRATATLLALILPPALVAFSWFVWAGRLPGEIASHWSGLGAADDALPTGVVFTIAIMATSLASVAGIALMLFPRVDRRIARGAVFWTGMVQGVGMSIWLIPAWLTLQAGSASEAVLGAWIIPLAASALYGAIPYLLAPKPAVAEARRIAAVSVAPGTDHTWSRTITASMFIWATLVVLAIGVAVAVPMLLAGEAGSAGFSLVILALAVVAVAAFIRLRITIDERGLRVESRLLRVPLKRVPLDRVLEVESTELRPSDWGGWGYRIMPGRTAIMLRGGPGMVVRTTDGALFAVTLDDPDEPAGVLAALSGAGGGELAAEPPTAAATP